MSYVNVWRCVVCGAQRGTFPVPPPEDEVPATWEPVAGGIAHLCQGDDYFVDEDGDVAMRYAPCELVILEGQEAELWLQLQSSLSDGETPT